MSTPFLLGYAAALVQALLDEGRLDVVPGREREVVAYLAGHLHQNGRGGSLISQTVRALLSCPDVEELYADDDEIKDRVETLRYSN